MKKILISILIVLLIVMAYISIFKGIKIGNLINILSVRQISEINNNLTKQITQTNDLITISFPERAERLRAETKTLLDKKKEYLDLASISTESEIISAGQKKEYRMEYLWTRVGNHATSEGVNLKMDVNNGDAGEINIHNLNFTVTGSYIGIINFIYAIENNTQLGFRIENFKLIPGTSEIDLNATFVVKNIRIKNEATSVTLPDNTEKVTNTNTNTDVDNTNTDNTNTNNQ